MQEITYAQAIASGLAYEMRRNDKVFVFGLDVDDHKAIQGSTKGLLEEFGPERIFGTPLSEDAMTGVAIGAAMMGFRPVHVHIRMDFITLAANQLINMAAKMHYMTNGKYNVPLVVRAMIGRSWGQGAQHSQSLYSMFAHVPGLVVIAPSNAHDAKAGIIAAIRNNNPVIFVEHRLLYSTKSFVLDDITPLEIGKARILRKGKDCTVVSLSHMLIESVRATHILEKLGIDVEIIDLISIKPLDIDTIYQSAKKTGHLAVIDNAWQVCGIASEIITQVVLRAQSEGINIKYGLDGFAETPCPTTKSLEDLFYPNQITIAEKVLKIMGKDIEKSQIISLHTIPKELNEFKGPF